MYKTLDKENMFSAIWDFPENLSEAHKLGENIKLEQDYRKFDFDSPWEGTKYIDEIKNKGKQDG